MTAIFVNYLQYQNDHIIFVTGINTRIVFMARPKSSLCMYTSTNIPMYVLQLHIITIIMYTVYIADILFTFNEIPANLKRNIIEPKRNSDSPFIFGPCLFMLKLCTSMKCTTEFKILFQTFENSRFFWFFLVTL
jgi:hypothetical protein